MPEATLLASARADERVVSVFDGESFREVRRGAGLCAAPALVDAGAGIGGYRDDLTAPLLQAPRAILRLLVEWGVAGVRVSSSSWAEHANFRAIRAEAGARAPALTGGGPVLTDEEPTSERQRWVRDADELARAVRVAEVEQVGWVSVQTDQPAFAIEAVGAAHRVGLRVALRAPVSAAAPLREGDLFVGLGNLRRFTNRDRALQVLLAWADAAALECTSLGLALAERGVGLTSELLNLHRNVFVRESLDVPFLEENVAILPHVRWLLQMRGAVGYISGRSALREHAGIAEPSRAEARQAAAGWDRLLEVTGRLHAGGARILPASTAPQMTQLPGFALKEELGVLLQAGIPLARVLATATDAAWLGLPEAGFLVASPEPPSDGPRFLAGLTPLTPAQPRTDNPELDVRGAPT